MAAPFQDISLAPATLVVARDGGLTAADNAAVDQLESQIRGVDRVKVVVDLGVSRDGQARQALIEASVIAFSAGPEASGVVDAIRSTFQGGNLPAGLQVHLTGQLAIQVDTVKASGSSQDQTQQLSLLFIVVLLLLAFRAVLAPIVTLIPAAFVLVLSGPVIAEATKIGVQVSSITQLLLIVLILGAGTDYGVFLVFRVREELRRGLTPQEAVIRSVSRVGESITFSALTVIAALVSLVLAEFAFYQSLGPALAIGIALMLVAGLTLLPALLAIFGRAVFWPTGASVRTPRTHGPVGPHRRGRHAAAGRHARRGGRAVRRPGRDAPDDRRGRLRRRHLQPERDRLGRRLGAHRDATSRRRPPAGVRVLMQFPASVWDDPSVLARAQDGLAGLSELSGLVGPLNPNGIPLTTDQLTQLHTTLGPARELPPVGDDDRGPRAGLQRLPGDRPAHQPRRSHDPVLGRVRQRRRLEPGGPRRRAGHARRCRPRRAIGRRVRVRRLRCGRLRLDISHISGSDLVRIIPIVAVLIALLLAIVLRSLVAPLYLVASIVLSYAAALGLVGIIFVHLGGQDGISFILPFLMFVFLMALGSDYNILIMSRIREEAHHLPLRDAVARAIGRTGSTITTAGVILGGTFAVLAVAGGSAGGGQIQQIGYGVAAGVLMDTFLAAIAARAVAGGPARSPELVAVRAGPDDGRGRLTRAPPGLPKIAAMLSRRSLPG